MGPITLPPTLVTTEVTVASMQNFTPHRVVVQTPLTRQHYRHHATVWFAAGNATLTGAGWRTLRQLFPDAHYRVTGFASAINAPALNLALSLKRANAVAHFLQGGRTSHVCGNRGGRTPYIAL